MTFIIALQNPNAYAHSVSMIDVIETHISWVLLTGDYAYKIKKPIQFDFLDFSTLEKRRFYCLEELRLNRRLAPDLYLQVVPITGNDTTVQINGNGQIIDYAVQMRQFSSQQLLSMLADQHELSTDIIDQLADLIADFHAEAAIADVASDYGSIAMIEHWCLSNFNHIRPLLNNEQQLAQLNRLQQWCDVELTTKTALLQQRKAQGFVRECHGDLHLGNIALFQGKVTPFDGIEFNLGLHWIDVSNEIAFVVMDLQERGLNQLAYRLLNRYLSRTGDYQGLSILRYYLVYRALVRAKVALLSWQQHQQARYLTNYQNYADLAERFTQTTPPLLIITHGYSGSGKSTISTQLAERLGLMHLRSDVERQRLFANSRQDIYSEERIAQTYQYLAKLTNDILQAGFAVIVDATFLKQQQRQLFQQIALAQQVKFVILDLQASIEALIQRIEQRQSVGVDASEATVAVLQQQLQQAEPLSSDEQQYVITMQSINDLYINHR
jgi:uncharacterized protein